MVMYTKCRNLTELVLLQLIHGFTDIEVNKASKDVGRPCADMYAAVLLVMRTR